MSLLVITGAFPRRYCALPRETALRSIDDTGISAASGSLSAVVQLAARLMAERQSCQQSDWRPIDSRLTARRNPIPTKKRFHRSAKHFHHK
ncbi:MAG: hypothetical protein MSC53_02565 [Arcanobacterium sp.]|nr:hypothetical protein [Arcanobacterium sp.]MDY5273479.1 hypothetical protein [Arcanobacterium sp.]